MAAPCPLLGDGITDDTLLHIARFIPTARDMLCLQLACPRFAAKSAQQQGGSGGSQRRSCCRSWRRRRGCGWRGAAIRSVNGCHGVSSRAGCV